MLELDRIYRERGWPKAVYYVGDEIDYPERIRTARLKLEALRATSPDIRFTTALGEIGAAALGHMYDVWIGCSTEEQVKRALDMGKQPWTYSCRPVYEVGPAYMRYRFGSYAWKIGLRGMALWCYTEDDVFFDRFGRNYAYGKFAFTPDYKQAHGHVFFEDGEIIPSVTWEAVREGIHDYRAMRTLKNMAEEALRTGDRAARRAAEAGLRLLEDIAADTDPTPALNDCDGSPYLRDWRYMGDMDGRRDRVVAVILRLMAAGGR